MTLRLRVARPDDLELLGALITASYATLDDGSYDPAQIGAAMPLMSRANPTLLASGTYYVAEDDGDAAGCGGWTFEAPGTGERTAGLAHIRHFATHPRHRRKGVARLLLDHCLREAHIAGATRIRSQATLPAERFYAAAGFRRVGAIEVGMAPGVTLPAIEMERPLP